MQCWALTSTSLHPAHMCPHLPDTQIEVVSTSSLLFTTLYTNLRITLINRGFICVLVMSLFKTVI